MSVSFPVFVLAKDCGEVSRFISLEEMERDLEAIDIENDEYVAWDRVGMPLKLSVRKPAWLQIEPWPLKSHGPRLQEALIQYAATVGIELKIAGANEADFEQAFTQISAHVGNQDSKSLLSRIIAQRKKAGFLVKFKCPLQP